MSVDNVGYYSTGGDINTFSINPVMSSTDEFDVAFQPLAMVYNTDDNNIPSYVTGAYNCVDGSCVPALGGPFDTIAHCRRSCGIKPAPSPYIGGGFTCTPQGCTPSYGGGEYNTLGDCRRTCGYVPTPSEAVGYECHTMGNSGVCLPTDGSTQSLIECHAKCDSIIPPSSPTDDICSRLKSATYDDAQSYGSLLKTGLIDPNINQNSTSQQIYDACVSHNKAPPNCQADLDRFCRGTSRGMPVLPPNPSPLGRGGWNYVNGKCVPVMVGNGDYHDKGTCLKHHPPHPSGMGYECRANGDLGVKSCILTPGSTQSRSDCLENCKPIIPPHSLPTHNPGYECHMIGSYGVCLPNTGKQSAEDCGKKCPSLSSIDICDNLMSSSRDHARNYGHALVKSLAPVNSDPTQNDINRACALSIGDVGCVSDVDYFCREASTVSTH